jgi:hypothetical protein
MFSTAEIRWFRISPMPELFDWFQSNGAEWERTTERTDFYQRLPREDLGIKLREGSVESKLRTSNPHLFTLQDGYTGYVDTWEKFSFRIKEEDTETGDILSGMFEGQWISVRKRRMGLKAVSIGEGRWDLLPMHEFPENGIQLEYTRIELNDRTHYSFCLESFGADRPSLESWNLPLPPQVKLLPEESYSYPEFLSR